MGDVLESMKDLVSVSSGGKPAVIFIGSLLFAIGISIVGGSPLAGTILILLGILLVLF